MYINVLALFGGSSSIFSVWKVKDLLVDANFTCYTKVICAAVVGAREAFKKKNVFLFYLYAIFLLFSFADQCRLSTITGQHVKSIVLCITKDVL